jgi:hypothetical protein
MYVYDTCIAWNWIDDRDFVEFFVEQCISNDLSVLVVTTDILENTLEALDTGLIEFRSFIDRATDTNKKFLPLNQWAFEHNALRINPQERAMRSLNKATMHLDLMTAGINTPHTIILPPYEKQPVISGIDLRYLGENFFIKPAHGGGGEGIVRNANSIHEVLIARQTHPADYYLLQRHVKSIKIGDRPAWFRVIYCGGTVFPNWWNPFTHHYIPVTPEESECDCLQSLWTITDRISRECRLDLFSTEIALAPENYFVVVDYVNDQIDLRLQSVTPDGVPDHIVRSICEIFVSMIFRHCRCKDESLT